MTVAGVRSALLGLFSTAVTSSAVSTEAPHRRATAADSAGPGTAAASQGIALAAGVCIAVRRVCSSLCSALLGLLHGEPQIGRKERESRALTCTPNVVDAQSTTHTPRSPPPRGVMTRRGIVTQARSKREEGKTRGLQAHRLPAHSRV